MWRPWFQPVVELRQLTVGALLLKTSVEAESWAGKVSLAVTGGVGRIRIEPICAISHRPANLYHRTRRARRFLSAAHVQRRFGESGVCA